jgi:hypothetical protein
VLLSAWRRAPRPASASAAPDTEVVAEFRRFRNELGK